tara:strand:+ start:377 stop:925 length:549 start_codon:yes stop_codon:yes gene_type:complete
MPSKLTFKQQREYIRTQVTDIEINKEVGLQTSAQRQRELGDNPLSNADAVVSYSALGLVSAYYIYYLSLVNYWIIASSTSFSTSGSGYLLGIASGAAYPKNAPASEVGVFLKGIIKLPRNTFSGTPLIGAPIYLNTSYGTYTFTAPSSSGNIVRILGFCLSISDDETAVTMYFNPDKTWVEV